MLLKLLVYYVLFAFFILRTLGHVPEYIVPSNRIEQYCYLAESCVHDTIPICGKNGDSKRTFLDTCDLLEYACDSGNVYMHVDDMPDCPVFKRSG